MKTNLRYVVRATISGPDGQLSWTTDRAYPVDPEKREQDVGTLELVRVASNGASGAGLPGDSYRVEDIDRTGVIDNSNVTVMFGSDGTVSGSTGCNTFTGKYTVDGATLSIGPLAMTRRACIPALGEQETRFVKVLQDVSSWFIDRGGRLVLRTGDGRSLTAAL
ncbi:META domain-containing protein [Altererythrobacter salegens]|uniref:META domain-containing protein n=2 Tax=Croceibacterium salegens TaxID=1737568 RepID=A0A6I4SWS9_9SPHN|nr:META domain-containing protein [Croceibacterium salegens]